MEIEISEKEKQVLKRVLDAAVDMSKDSLFDELDGMKKNGTIDELDELERGIEELITMYGLLVKLSNL